MLLFCWILSTHPTEALSAKGMHKNNLVELALRFAADLAAND